jgi:polysaccharide export outer membrane protein
MTKKFIILIFLLPALLLSCATTRKETLWERAIVTGGIDNVKRELDKIGNINVRDGKGWTPLMYAAREGKIDIVKFLIVKKADVNAQSNSGLTALIIAATNKIDPVVVKLLLDNGANINATSKDGLTAAHMAAYKGNIDTMKILIMRGANMNIVDKPGYTPLQYADQEGHVEIVRLLLGKEGVPPVQTNVSNPSIASLSKIMSEKVQAKKTQGAVVTDSDTYIIGPEDVLYINVWREEQISRTVPVRMDGKISLPLVDDVQAAELTPLQLKDVLTNKLKNVLDNPTVSVSVMEANSFKVYVSGEVKTPSVLKLRSETSLIQIMSMVGGFTEWADRKNILIIRKENGTERRIMVNYKKIIDGKEPDVTIKGGDMVIVP